MLAPGFINSVYLPNGNRFPTVPCEENKKQALEVLALLEKPPS